MIVGDAIWLGRPVVSNLRTTSTGGASTLVNVRPAAGERWYLLGGFGYHNDASSRTAAWWLNDASTGDETLGDAITLAPNIKMWLKSYSGNTTDLPRFGWLWPLSNDVYLTFQVLSLANTKIAAVEAYYLSVIL